MGGGYRTLRAKASVEARRHAARVDALSCPAAATSPTKRAPRRAAAAASVALAHGHRHQGPELQLAPHEPEVRLVLPQITPIKHTTDKVPAWMRTRDDKRLKAEQRAFHAAQTRDRIATERAAEAAKRERDASQSLDFDDRSPWERNRERMTEQQLAAYGMPVWSPYNVHPKLKAALPKWSTNSSDVGSFSVAGGRGSGPAADPVRQRRAAARNVSEMKGRACVDHTWELVGARPTACGKDLAWIDFGKDDAQ